MEAQQTQNQGASPPTPPPRPVEVQLQYGKCMEAYCDCPGLVKGQEPQRCGHCNHDYPIHAKLDNVNHDYPIHAKVDNVNHDYPIHAKSDNVNQLLHFQYGECTECPCSTMYSNESDPERCGSCNHYHKLNHYGNCMEIKCNCKYLILNEHDPQRCGYCQHDRFIHLLLNEQGNVEMNQMMKMMSQIQIQPKRPPPPNTIWFYNRNEPYYEFTNFKEGYPIKAALSFHGTQPELKLWRTSEHLFQAAKFMSHKEIADRICLCYTARDALNMARIYRDFVDPNWSSMKVQVMEEVVRIKFEQYGKLAKRLLDTGDMILVEHTDVDKFWGDGGDGSGMNMLGKILMRIREDFKNRNTSRGGTGAGLMYSILGPASSSSSSLQTYNVGNGYTYISEQSSPQQQHNQLGPPPLPPRREKKRDKAALKQVEKKVDNIKKKQQVQQHQPSIQLQQSPQGFQQQQICPSDIKQVEQKPDDVKQNHQVQQRHLSVQSPQGFVNQQQQIYPPDINQVEQKADDIKPNQQVQQRHRSMQLQQLPQGFVNQQQQIYPSDIYQHTHHLQPPIQSPQMQPQILQLPPQQIHQTDMYQQILHPQMQPSQQNLQKEIRQAATSYGHTSGQNLQFHYNM